MNTAAKVAQHKEKHPEKYCIVQGCLWRTDSTLCPRHAKALRTWENYTETDAAMQDLVDDTEGL